jgi:hypothetical protein
LNGHKGLSCEGVDWIYLAQDMDQLSGTCEQGNLPSVSIKSWDVIDYLLERLLAFQKAFSSKVLFILFIANKFKPQSDFCPTVVRL